MRNQGSAIGVRRHQSDQLFIGKEKQRVISKAILVILHIVALKKKDAVLGSSHELIPSSPMLLLITGDLDHVSRRLCKSDRAEIESVQFGIDPSPRLRVVQPFFRELQDSSIHRARSPSRGSNGDGLPLGRLW